jgi:hypothetical protein
MRDMMYLGSLMSQAMKMYQLGRNDMMELDIHRTSNDLNDVKFKFFLQSSAPCM